MNRPAPYADNHLFEEIASWKARAEAAEAKLAGFDSPTAESVPPAVVEAMASVIRDWNDRYLTFPTELIHAALSAALATGSVVICSPEITNMRESLKVATDRLTQEGVCMSCWNGPPDPYGCSDCLNTGYQQGIRNIPETPELKALMEAAKLYASRVRDGFRMHAELTQAALAFARAHQEDKG